MNEIEHKYVKVNGLNLHVAEIGNESSPAVVFLHGVPEIWYSWRHQMMAVAKAGFRAIAFDYRGFGLSDQPLEPQKTTLSDFVNDVLALLDTLNISKVFLIGKDFGAHVVSSFVLFHEEKISGFITMGVPFMVRRPVKQHDQLPEGFYISRWRESGRAEADFGRFDAKTVVRNIYILFSSSEIPIADEKQEVMDMVDASTPLPPWFTEQDLETYGTLYEKSGFRTALKVAYRSYGEQTNQLPADPKVQVPALLIMGEKDYAFKVPAMRDYIRSEKVKDFVPKLEIVFIPEGSHFVQEQFPDEVNRLVLDFLKKL